jgi:hypothetical protein
MKRKILLIGIVVIGLIAEGDIQAQRRSDDGRNRDKVEKRDDRKGNGRYDRPSNNKKVKVERDGRRVVEVKKVVVRNNGYRYSNTSNNRNNRYDDFDYDFRNGRRFQVSRGRAPSSSHIWVNGYWEYNRRLRRDVWITGHWTVRRDYHRYQEAHYGFIGGVRLWVPGCWVRIF